MKSWLSAELSGSGFCSRVRSNASTCADGAGSRCRRYASRGCPARCAAGGGGDGGFWGSGCACCARNPGGGGQRAFPPFSAFGLLCTAASCSACADDAGHPFVAALGSDDGGGEEQRGAAAFCCAGPPACHPFTFCPSSRSLSSFFRRCRCAMSPSGDKPPASPAPGGGAVRNVSFIVRLLRAPDYSSSSSPCFARAVFSEQKKTPTNQVPLTTRWRVFPRPDFHKMVTTFDTVHKKNILTWCHRLSCCSGGSRSCLHIKLNNAQLTPLVITAAVLLKVTIGSV